MTESSGDAVKAKAAQREWTQADAERENSAFDRWFKERGYPDYPQYFPLTTENAMHAAWQAAAKRAALSRPSEQSARIAALEAENARLRQALDRLWKEAEGAYCQGLNQFSKTECLGWEAKVKAGVFGEAEYEAHKKANQLIGRHHGIAHAVKTIRAALSTKEPTE